MSVIQPVQAVVNSSLSVTVQFFIMDMSAYLIQADVAGLSQYFTGTVRHYQFNELNFCCQSARAFDDSWLCFIVF